MLALAMAGALGSWSVLANPQEPEWPAPFASYNVSWIANTWGGGNCSVAPSYGNGWMGKARHCWVKRNIGGMATCAQSGITFTSSGWDEAHNEMQIFLPDGAQGGKLAGNPDLGGNLQAGLGPITTTSKYVFGLVSRTFCAKPCPVWGIGRYTNHHSTDLSDNVENFPPANFGPGVDGVGQTQNVFVLGVNASLPDASTRLGLAACEDGALYYWNSNTSLLTVYDPETMRVRATHSLVLTNVSSAGNPMVCGPTGLLYVLRSDRVSAISTVGANIQDLAVGLTAPGAIAFDTGSSTLFVSDNDRSRNNVQIFAVGADIGQTAKPVGSFGEPGGIFGSSRPPGTFGTHRFYGIDSLSADNNGCLILNNAHGSLGGTDLRKFCPADGVARPKQPIDWAQKLPSFKMMWRRENHYWQEVGDLSRLDEDVVFMNEMKFRINWSQPVDKSESDQQGFWSAEATVLDRETYPDSLLNHQNSLGFGYGGTTFIRQVKGAELHFRHNTGLNVGVSRFQGEIAVPCAMFGALTCPSYRAECKTNETIQNQWPWSRGAPNSPLWRWQDRNGDGQMEPAEFTDQSEGGAFALRGSGLAVDEMATVWHRVVSHAGSFLYKWPVDSVDTHGCPQYALAPALNLSWPPSEFNESASIRGCGDCGRFAYVSSTDTMFVADFTQDRPQNVSRPGIGEEAGSVLCRYDKFTSRSVAGAVKKADLCFDLPYWNNNTGRAGTYGKPGASPWANMTHSLSVAGNCIFIGMLAEPGVEAVNYTTGGAMVWVFDASTGENKGALNPDNEYFMGSAGWIDIEDGAIAALRKDGSVVVFVEDVFFEKMVTFQIPPGVCSKAAASHVVKTDDDADLTYAINWVGNTWGGGICPGHPDDYYKGTRNQSGCHVHAHTAGLAVDFDTGTVFTSGGWDEAHNEEMVVLADGSYAGRTEPVGGELGTGFGKYSPVATGGGLMIEVQQRGKDWGVARHSTNISTGWSAPRFGDLTKKDPAYPDHIFLNLTGSKGVPPANVSQGLALCGGRLFVADSNTSTVTTYNATSMTQIGTPVHVADVGPLACAENGQLIMMQPVGGRVVLIDPTTGQVLKTLTTGTDSVDAPSAVAFDPTSSTAVVATATQVHFLSLDGTLHASFGEPGGLFGSTLSRGTMGDRRLYNITAVGIDAQGCVVLNCGVYTTDLRRFCMSTVSSRPTSPKEWQQVLEQYELTWARQNFYWQEVGDVSRVNDSVVHMNQFKYEVDWQASVNETDSSNRGAWRAVAMTIDASKYPDDIRLHQNVLGFGYGGTTMVRAPDVATGHSTPSEFVYRTNTGAYLAVWRQDSDILAPCTLWGSRSMNGWDPKPNAADLLKWPTSRGAPWSTMWLWQDENGDGAMTSSEFVDLAAGTQSRRSFRSVGKLAPAEDGHIWHRVESSESGISRHYLYMWEQSAVSAHGCPVYNATPTVNITWPPAPFNETDSIRGCGDCGRLDYDSVTDTMWVADFTSARPQSAPRVGIGEEVGSVACRYDHFMQDITAKKQPAPALCFDLPYWVNSTEYSPHGSNVWANMTHALSTAGNCVFIGMLAEPGVTVPPVNYTTGGALIYVYSGKTGKLLGELNPDDKAYIGSSGWMDIADGTSAFMRGDGSVLVFAEDVFFEKMVTYLLPPGVC